MSKGASKRKKLQNWPSCKSMHQRFENALIFVYLENSKRNTKIMSCWDIWGGLGTFRDETEEQTRTMETHFKTQPDFKTRDLKTHELERITRDLKQLSS